MRIKFPYIIFILSLILFACSQNYTPKPPGYMRIDFPEKDYVSYDTNCPYTFDIPVYAKPVYDLNYKSEPCWVNLSFPQFNSQIHLSYKSVNNNLAVYTEDSRTFVYKHAVKADAIEEQVYENPEKNVYGILYDIKGNAASSLQFILTDSTNHFLRGALYFNSRPNKDSLAPVVHFIRQDIVRIMESLEWK
jgi:gliding motility-associated lipoprotein GldD